MPLKKCNKCSETKEVCLFYANKRMKDGLNTFCIQCHKADNVARKEKNRSNEVFRAKELLYKQQYRHKTAEHRAEYITSWRHKNKDHVANYSKTYRTENKARYAYLCQKRKISFLQRTPKWLDQDDFWLIAEAYHLAELRTKMTGVAHHVDHIIPLRGKNVSGLHVPLNLQVITFAENQRKTNKFQVL